MRAGKAAAPAPVAEILGIPSGRRALRRTETRGDDGQAASITVSWYPPAIADRAPRLADDQPLPAGTLAYIAEATGNRAARVDEENAAGPAGDDIAAALGDRARLTCPAHPHPALHRRRQAHRVRRNHDPRRALAQPHLHHHRKLTQAAAGVASAGPGVEVVGRPARQAASTGKATPTARWPP